MSENNMVYLGGLWLNESKSGEKYFSGKMGMARVLIFKNKNKSADNQPDYNMYIVSVDRRDTVDSDEQQEDIPF